jgi:hypothetical protein
MHHRAHLIVVTMPTDRSLGTRLSDSNGDVHTLLFAHRGECHRTRSKHDADRGPAVPPGRECRSHWSVRAGPQLPNSMIGGGPRSVHPYTFPPERAQVTSTTRRLTIAGRDGDPVQGPEAVVPLPGAPRCPWMPVDARSTKALDSSPSLRRYLPSERSVGHGAVFVLHGSPHRDPDTDAYS